MFLGLDMSAGQCAPVRALKDGADASVEVAGLPACQRDGRPARQLKMKHGARGRAPLRYFAAPNLMPKTGFPVFMLLRISRRMFSAIAPSSPLSSLVTCAQNARMSFGS